MYDLNGTSVFFQMPYFGSQVIIWTLNAQPTLVFSAGIQGSHSVAEHLKQPKDGYLGSKPNLFFKIFICNTLFLRIITLVTAVVAFCFQG